MILRSYETLSSLIKSICHPELNSMIYSIYIVSFAGLTGDWRPQYVDTEFARKSMFGERIAHGMLVYLIEHNWAYNLKGGL